MIGSHENQIEASDIKKLKLRDAPVAFIDTNQSETPDKKTVDKKEGEEAKKRQQEETDRRFAEKAKEVERLAGLPPQGERDAEAAAYAKANGLPVGPENLQEKNTINNTKEAKTVKVAQEEIKKNETPVAWENEKSPEIKNV